jgi:hypothetical protein
MKREPNPHEQLAHRFEQQKQALVEEVEQLRAELAAMDDEAAQKGESSDESPPEPSQSSGKSERRRSTG